MKTKHFVIFAACTTGVLIYHEWRIYKTLKVSNRLGLCVIDFIEHYEQEKVDEIFTDIVDNFDE